VAKMFCIQYVTVGPRALPLFTWVRQKAALQPSRN